jgi:hypothetical protein
MFKLILHVINTHATAMSGPSSHTHLRNYRISTKSGAQFYNKYYLLTPWSRVLLEKLTGFQLLKKFLAFYGT